MSVEEDNDLRNLLAQTLENRGILPKIRAELRANIFLALAENASTRETLLKNEELSSFIQIPVGILILNLVREFLEFFGLDFTLSVFDPETKYGKDYNAITREDMIKDLNITESTKKGPLLYEIISNIVKNFESESKNNFKNVVTLNLSECDAPINGDLEAASPSSYLNSTYVKTKLDDGFTANVNESNVNGDEENDSIEEELSSKSSLTENSSNKFNMKKIEGIENNISTPIVNENSFKPIPENSSDYDLLTFTPVKEAKAKGHKAPEDTEKQDLDVKGKTSMLVLGDLPPLNGKTEHNKNKMNEIKAIISEGLNLDNYEDDFHSSVSSRSSMNDKSDVEDSDKYVAQNLERLQNLDVSNESEKTDIVDEENIDDLSDIISTHNCLESQMTADETVSRISDLADHLESL